MHNDGVVILHGIFRTHRSMAKLANFLEKNGYRVLNLSYPSTAKPIEEIASHIHPTIQNFSTRIPGKLHFVGYSMGGLVIRHYLHQFHPEKLGRVVMLGTPNQGSEVADFIQNWWLYKKLYGPAGQQLVTQFKDAEKLFGKVNYDLGIIAGNFPIDPFFSYIIDVPNDGKVSITSTKLEGMKEHRIVSVSHTFFPTNKKVLIETLCFLDKGSFSPPV